MVDFASSRLFSIEKYRDSWIQKASVHSDLGFNSLAVKALRQKVYVIQKRPRGVCQKQEYVWTWGWTCDKGPEILQLNWPLFMIQTLMAESQPANFLCQECILWPGPGHGTLPKSESLLPFWLLDFLCFLNSRCRPQLWLCVTKPMLEVPEAETSSVRRTAEWLSSTIWTPWVKKSQNRG